MGCGVCVCVGGVVVVVVSLKADGDGANPPAVSNEEGRTFALRDKFGEFQAGVGAL